MQAGKRHKNLNRFIQVEGRGTESTGRLKSRKQAKSKLGHTGYQRQAKTQETREQEQSQIPWKHGIQHGMAKVDTEGGNLMLCKACMMK